MSMSEEDHARMMKRMLTSCPGVETFILPDQPELLDGQFRHMASQRLQSISADALAKQTAAVRGVRTDNKRKGQHQLKKQRNQKGKSR